MGTNRWRIVAGRYTVELGHASRDFSLRDGTDAETAGHEYNRFQ
ncbi:hypothetical protein [Rhodanobacter sp. DHG33]|nr:hypothetical protein [Rhodanobacter sp. DHG33]